MSGYASVWLYSRYGIYGEDNNYNSDKGNRIPVFQSIIHFVAMAGNNIQASADHHMYVDHIPRV
jgi:hypothetical protein